ncbi:MAG TPA: GNAT family N-acetyltransferase [Candidatus Eisenbacteria bacterium]|nr:GNAT family N-acetyltransferase [Candidatus Eisenbacteria bacterium]
MNAPALGVSRQPPDSETAQQLLRELDEELASRYPSAAIHGLHPGEADDPRLIFLVAELGSDPVGCGALRSLDAATAEIKRMFVRSAYRGQGIARTILLALESEAREAGYKKLWLETGSRQPEAIELYRTADYVPRAPYGEYVGNPYSVCMEKEL